MSKRPMAHKINRKILKFFPVGMAALLIVAIGSFSLQALALSLPTSCNDASNEVIWCGVATPAQLEYDYNHGDGHNSAVSIQNIYSYFGITAADISSMQTKAVAGSVTKSGDVLVNGKVVATNAITAGRQTIPGSTAVTYHGTTFYKRPPSVSFLANSLSAFVVMNNNRFSFAILSSCGNSIVATPIAPTPKPKPAPTPKPTTPNYTITKQVALNGTNNYTNDVIVHPNTTVDYRVEIKSTGSADVTNLLAKDVMPSGDVYNQNSLTLNGKKESSSQAIDFFTSGLSLGTLAPNATDVFQYSAVAGANQNNSNCTNETLPNVASMQASNLPNENSTATVSVQCVPIATFTTPKSTTTTTTKTTTPTTTTTPAQAPAPSQLVNTGPGDTIGVFIGVSAVGAIGYSVFQRRRAYRS